MDREDRMFVRVAGERSVRVLRSKNIKLWKVFRQRCEENGEKPETVLGRILYKFAKSVVEEDGEFAEDLLSRVVNISALRKREDIFKKLDELIEVKKKLEQSGSDELDALIKQLITTELTKATKSPVEMIMQGATATQSMPEQRIVIDEHSLASLDPQSLEALEHLVKKVKSEKMKAMSLTSEDIEKIVGGEYVEREEAEEELGEGNKGYNESDVGIEETG